jgi:hypothetical protein
MDNKPLSLLILVFPAACSIGILVDLYKEFRSKTRDIIARIEHSYFLVLLITLIEMYIKIIMDAYIDLDGSIEIKIFIFLRIAFPSTILFNILLKSWQKNNKQEETYK